MIARTLPMRAEMREKVHAVSYENGHAYALSTFHVPALTNR